MEHVRRVDSIVIWKRNRWVEGERLTWNVPIPAFERMKEVEEFYRWNFESFEQISLSEDRVSYLNKRFCYHFCCSLTLDSTVLLCLSAKWKIGKLHSEILFKLGSFSNSFLSYVVPSWTWMTMSESRLKIFMKINLRTPYLDAELVSLAASSSGKTKETDAVVGVGDL